MKLLQYWYLATIVLFISVATHLLWTERGHIFKKHWKFIGLFTLFSIPFAYWDGVAQRWHAYQYNPAHTIYLKIFGGELETYIFMGLVSMVVCSATVIYMRQEEKGKLKLVHHSRSKRRLKLMPRRRFAVVGAIRR